MTTTRKTPVDIDLTVDDPSNQLLATLSGVRFRPSNYAVIAKAIDEELTRHERPECSPRGLTIGYVNPHVITSAMSHPEILLHLDECDYVCIDGTGVWLALQLWRHGIERLPAYRACDYLLDSGVLRGSLAVIGIAPELIGPAADEIVRRNPNVDIVVQAHGFSTDDEIEASLANSQPQTILIGAGAPRSEQFALIARRVCPDAIVFHVGGGTFNNYAGVRPHAPRILSTLGVDWIHRFVTEPHTRARYLKGLPDFAFRVRQGPNSVEVEAIEAYANEENCEDVK